jgi:hypothetical protein
MGTEQVVALFRSTMQMALVMGAPLLLIAVFVSLLVNIVQVLTSLQDGSGHPHFFPLDVAQADVFHHRPVVRLPPVCSMRVAKKISAQFLASGALR